MRLVLFVFTLLVFVCGILANIITTTTPKPLLRPGGKTAYRSVGGNSRRSRDVNGGQPDKGHQRDEELKESGSDLHGVGSQSRRRGRDVSGMASVDQIPMGQDNRFSERDLSPHRWLHQGKNET
ncbi:uncharacterized protein LOC111063574 isoform X1 [Nilaparvata lugens]|uniref:uncharacterized protein LOC111063574 isoform X1 n=1 Tax=Nilaparvata lugens TaxID=108931 RepID=UPI00193DA0D9|nr:uncharacterized protein LOC111063574 isoform X1 [Nilaparvata lugens]